ncbi:MAG: putative integral rane protein, partial [Microbacterium sp.]|nr:putative integral rane protein [Microbacterium sp.]
MIRRRSHPDSSVSTTRTEAYTDAVFAIAATLLVLDLTTRSFGELTTDAEL